MQNLATLFGSTARVKLMRLFLFSPDQYFEEKNIETRAKITRREMRKELKLLKEGGVLTARTITIRLAVPTPKATGKKSKKKVRKPKVRIKQYQQWALNQNYSYLDELRALLINSKLLTHNDVARRLNRVGKIKLLVLSGVFVQSEDGRIDVLIVGDGLKRGMLESAMKQLEAEVGKELSYASFETPDFQYRVSMYDKLVRDVLDFPHQKIINKLPGV